MRDVRAVGIYALGAAVVVGAAVIRALSWLNCDVSWLLTIGEDVLGGARPYVDFSEPNPPASFLIYLPAIVIARLMAVSAESIVSGLLIVGTMASLWLAGHILTGGGLLAAKEKSPLFVLACVVLLILPGDAFAQREHVALLAVLPMLSVYAVRADGAGVTRLLASLAGIGGGIAIAIKPYFALALALPLPYILWCGLAHRQKLGALILSPEHITAAAVLLAYGALLLLWFSDYLQQTLPLVLALYVPLKYSLLLMLDNPSVILVALVALICLGAGAGELRAPIIRVGALAVLGFTLSLIIQGKGWPYHGYPAIALAMLVLSLVLVRRSSRAGDAIAKSVVIDLAFGGVLFACIYGVASYWFLLEPSRAKLVSEVARLAPPHPKVVSFTEGPELAFPLMRKLHATAIARVPFQWVSHNAESLLASAQLTSPARHRLEEYARVDRAELAATIHTRQPDAILIGGQWELAWALSHPEIAAALRPYRKAKTVDGVEIWLPLRRSGERRRN